VTKDDPNATPDGAQSVGGAGGEERSGRKQGPKPSKVLTATVLGRRQLGPSLIRLTLGGAGLEHLAYQGYDQWFRLFLPREGDGRMRLPAGDHDDDWCGQYQAATEDQRAWMRSATVADSRPSAANGPGPGCGSGPELDVDVVVHGQHGDPGSGPLSTWAQTAAPGDRVALLDQGTIFGADKVEQDVLLIGDETAVPAVVGILRRLAPGVRGRA